MSTTKINDNSVLTDIVGVVDTVTESYTFRAIEHSLHTGAPSKIDIAISNSADASQPESVGYSPEQPQQVTDALVQLATEEAKTANASSTQEAATVPPQEKCTWSTQQSLKRFVDEYLSQILCSNCHLLEYCHPRCSVHGLLGVMASKQNECATATHVVVRGQETDQHGAFDDAEKSCDAILSTFKQAGLESRAAVLHVPSAGDVAKTVTDIAAKKTAANQNIDLIVVWLWGSGNKGRKDDTTTTTSRFGRALQDSAALIAANSPTIVVISVLEDDTLNPLLAECNRDFAELCVSPNQHFLIDDTTDADETERKRMVDAATVLSSYVVKHVPIKRQWQARDNQLLLSLGDDRIGAAMICVPAHRLSSALL